MESRIRLYLYTFLGVGLTVFIIGFFGINISLKYIQRNYIQLQIDVNKRQAERMAHTIKSEIKMGIPLDSIRSAFQSSIQGTEFDKGFLCMYDTRLNQLVCHPDVNAIGVSFNKDFVFRYQNSNANVYITDVYGKKKPAGGIFVQGKIRTDIIYTVPIEGTNWFVNAHENINAISEEIKRLRFVYILGSLIFGLIISIAASMTARRISRNYEKRIEQKNVELQALNYKINLQKDEISSQLNEIEKKSKEITDSINYAEKIQSALLPPLTLIKSYFPESFVLYKPKAIVSGDFYWSCRISNRILVGVFDCTGHGVPGAFMSMLGITLLNETVIREGIDTPNLIFNRLREKIIEALGQKGTMSEVKDGMDGSLISYDISDKTLTYCGAYNPLYLIRENEIIEIKADKMPLSYFIKMSDFSSQKIEIRQNDQIYLFTDGYIDQFGGGKMKKISSSRFKEILVMNHNNPLEDQKQLLIDTFYKWKGDEDQIDDITIAGIRIG